METKNIETYYYKLKNDCTGQCENCGEDLGAWKWRVGESTGCTISCAVSAHKADLAEGNDE